jgi:hypothetical protein
VDNKIIQELKEIEKEKIVEVIAFMLLTFQTFEGPARQCCANIRGDSLYTPAKESIASGCQHKNPGRRTPPQKTNSVVPC